MIARDIWEGERDGGANSTDYHNNHHDFFLSL